MLKSLVFVSLICLVLSRPADDTSRHQPRLNVTHVKRQQGGLGVSFASNSSNSRPTSLSTRPLQPRPTSSPKVSSSASVSLSAADAKRWDAKAKTHSFQIILSAAPDLRRDARSVTPDVDVYDVDLFMTSKDIISTMKRLNKTVICYFSAGTYEPGRPDSSKFSISDQGNRLTEWPGEKWLKLSSPSVRRIMADRIQLASQKGCDAIDPDNVDGYAIGILAGTGSTKTETVDFVKFLADSGKKYGLATGLKNAMGIIREVGTHVQFAINEQCASKKECNMYATFRKPVYHIEYPPGLIHGPPTDSTKRRYCVNDSPSVSQYFHTVLKAKSLDGNVQYCDGQYAKTPTKSSSGGRSRNRLVDHDLFDIDTEDYDDSISYRQWQNNPEAVQQQAKLAAVDGYPFAPGKGSENVISDIELFGSFTD